MSKEIIITSLLGLLSTGLCFAADVPEHLYVVGCVYSSTHTDTSSYNFDGVELLKTDDIFTGEVEIYENGTPDFAIVGQPGASNWTKENYTLTDYRPDAEFQVVELNLKRSSTLTARLRPGTYNFTVDFSEDKPLLKIAKSGYTMSLYIVGALLDDSDNPYDFNGVQFEQDGDMFTCNNVGLHSNSDVAEFAIVENNGSSWNTGTAYVSSDPKWSITDAVTRKVPPTTSSARIMKLASGRYNFTFDYTKALPFLTISPAIKQDVTALPSLSISSGTPVYYDMYGKPVEHPESGIYIMRNGNTVSKVIIK